MHGSHWRRVMHGLIVVLLFGGSVALTGAQSSSTGRPGMSTSGSSVDPSQMPFPGVGGDDIPLDAGMRFRRDEARKLQRHKSMVDNANRLVEATRQFDSDIKDRPMTAEDEKKLEQIARLAHQVKEQMLGN